ncbi:catabolite repressor/activator [Frateuria aurantia]
MPPHRLKLSDIARLAGVSRATASYVVNGQARVRRISEETIGKVMAVVERSGFRIDAQAAALRRGESRMLGLIVPDLENASYARLTKLIERGSRQQGYQLLITDSDDEPDTERELALRLRAQGCATLIVASCQPDASSFYAPLQLSGLPIIALDRPMDPERFICVVSENELAARQLTMSLLDPLPTRMLWVDAMPQLEITQERRRGFAAAIAGLPVHIERWCGERYDRASGQQLGRQLLQQTELPDAIVTASYPLLAGLLDAFLECGPGVPGTLRMATFGDDPLLDFIPLRVNSMPQQHTAIATLALDCAMAAIRGHYTPGRQTITRQLRLR